MKVYQRIVGGKIIIGGVNAKVGISDGRTRHVNEVNNLLKVWGRMVGVDVVNGKELDEGREKQNALHI